MNPKLKLFDYVNAWIAFSAQILTIVSEITALIRNRFDHLHIPKKSDFE
jgi:hypothetical protein